MTLRQTFEKQNRKSFIGLLVKVKKKHSNLYTTEKEAPSQWKAACRRKRLRGGILN